MKKYSYAFALFLSLLIVGKAFATEKGKKISSRKETQHSQTK